MNYPPTDARISTAGKLDLAQRLSEEGLLTHRMAQEALSSPEAPIPTRRPRRDRLYPATHWRARLSSFLRRVSERLNPLVTP
jgi:hypothetical protein